MEGVLLILLLLSKAITSLKAAQNPSISRNQEFNPLLVNNFDQLRHCLKKYLNFIIKHRLIGSILQSLTIVINSVIGAEVIVTSYLAIVSSNYATTIVAEVEIDFLK